MEKSCINDDSSSKSTMVDQPQKQQLPFEVATLLSEIRKLIAVDAEHLPEKIVRLAADFRNFLENYQQLIRHASDLNDTEFRTTMLLGLTLLDSGGSDNRLIANLHELISGYQGVLTRDPYLTEFVLNVVLCLCLGKQRLTFKDIFTAGCDGLRQQQLDLLLNLSEEDVQASNLIRTIVLSRLYSKLCEISSFDALYRLLLLTSVIARVEILTDDIIESLLDRLVDILENMERRLRDQQLTVLLKIMSKNKWKEDWIAEESDIKGKPVYIEFRLQKIVNVVAKKLIKERQLKNRNQILRLVLRYFNSTALVCNESLLEAFILGVRKEVDPTIQEILSKMVREALKGQPTLKIVKSLIKNMKISTSQKNSSEVQKIIKNFELLEVNRKWNNISHQVLELFSKSSAVYFEGINIKSPFTVMAEVMLKNKLNEQGYLITLVGKRSSISLLVRKKIEKKDYYQLKVVDNNDPKFHQDIYDVEAPCDKLFLSASMSNQSEGMLVTVNNFCFLVHTQMTHIKDIILGNNIVSGKLTNKCAVQELQMFCVLHDFLETSQLFCRFRTKQLTSAQFKQSTQDFKILINLNNRGQWESKMGGGGVFGRFFHAAEQVAQQSECYSITKPSLRKVLQNSGNLDVFLLLIEYYSMKAKESQLVVLTDCILGFILMLLQEDDQKGEMRQWLLKSLPKFGLAIWIISYSTKEKHELISKIMSIMDCGATEKGPAIYNFNCECMRAVLLNFQIWRNFTYEDQLVVFSMLSKYLSSEQYNCAEFALENNQLRRIIIAIVVYYKLELTSDGSIKRKLTKQQLLKLQMCCRDVFTRCLCSTFKPIVESRNKGKISAWIQSARSVFHIAIVVSEAVVGNDNNPYYSKQSLLEMLRVVRRLIDTLSMKETQRLFQEMLNKEDLFKSIDSILMIMLEQQAPTGGPRFKKNFLYGLETSNSQEKVIELEEDTIIDLLEDILLDVLLLKQYSVEVIIKLFDSLRRRERDPVEVSYIFKLVPKLHRSGLQGTELLYNALSSKAKENLTSPSYYMIFRSDIEEFIRKTEQRFLVEILNSLSDLLGEVMRQDCEDRQLARLVLQKYMECERMQPISPIYFLHINRIKVFPEIAASVPPANLYRLSSAMEYKEFISFLQHNYKVVKAIDSMLVAGGILAFTLVRAPMLPVPEIVNLLNIYKAMEAEPEGVSTTHRPSMVVDLVLLRMFRKLNEILENHEQRKEYSQADFQTAVEACQQVFTEQVLNRLFKEIVYIDYYPSTVPRGGLSLELETFYNIFSSGAVVQIELLQEHRQVMDKTISTIESNGFVNLEYAERPVLSAIAQSTDKLTLGKYQPRTISKPNIQMLLNNRSINVDRARQAYDNLKVDSFDMISDYFQDYEGKCMEVEQSWKRDKQLNYYWQYFTFSKDNNFYSVDSTLDSFYSRVNIKVSSNHNRQQFPRRKTGAARYRLSSENNSSITKSEPDNDMIMMKSMVFDNAKEKKSNNRKPSEEVVQEKEQDQDSFYCEYIKPDGVFFGKFELAEGTATFHSNPSEQNLVKKDIYMELSTSEHLKQRKEKKKVFELSQCTVFSRRYILRHTAIEIFYQSKAYLFNFFLKSPRDELLKLIRKKVKACIVNRRLEFEREHLTEKWKLGKLSNFQYLMKINIYSGRTYNDLGQYPVFPWVLKNFTAGRVTKEFLQDPSNYRDLSLPMGRQNEARFRQFTKRMNEVETNVDSSGKFLYGSFYSNPTIITHYLIRLEPFSTLHWKHQSKRFDHADRLFSSIEEQYTSSTNNTSDLKQLIPEFYCWPEFLRNRNQLEFGRKQNKTQVNHVECPNWASCPEEVIFRFREALESEYASKHLHQWIDLVFGYKSKMKDALAHNNLFHQRTYEHDIFQKPGEQDEDDIRTAQIYVSEFGQVPEALFDAEHIARHAVQVNIVDCMYFVDECPQSTRIVLSNDDCLMVMSNTVMYLLQVNLLQLDSKMSRKQTIPLDSGQKKLQFLSSSGNIRWIEFSKEDIVVCSAIGLKSREILLKGRNTKESVLADDAHTIVTADESRIRFFSLRQNKLKQQEVSNCHQDQVYLLEYCKVSDIVVSVDRDSIVGMHYAKRRSKIRAFTIQLKQGEFVTKIRVHPLGLLLFWTNQQRLKVYSFAGDRFFAVQFKLPVPDEDITQIRLYSPDKSNILVSTSKGFIYSLDIFDIYRFVRDNPRLLYPIEGLGIIGSMLANNNQPSSSFRKPNRKASAAAINEPIVDFDVDWSHKPYWKLVVLYEKGKLCYYLNSKERQQRIHEQITEMGFS